MLQGFSIVEGVSYRGLADNTDGQCPSLGSRLGMRFHSLSKGNSTASKGKTKQGFRFNLQVLTDCKMLFKIIVELRLKQQPET